MVILVGYSDPVSVTCTANMTTCSSENCLDGIFGIYMDSVSITCITKTWPHVVQKTACCSGTGSYRIYQPQVFLQGDDGWVLRTERPVPVHDESLRGSQQGSFGSLPNARHTGQSLGSVGRVHGGSLHTRKVSGVAYSLSLCLSVSLCLSLSLSLSLSLGNIESLFTCEYWVELLSFSLCLSLFFSLTLSLSLSLPPSPSLPLPLPLSLSLTLRWKHRGPFYMGILSGIA